MNKLKLLKLKLIFIEKKNNLKVFFFKKLNFIANKSRNL